MADLNMRLNKTDMEKVVSLEKDSIFRFHIYFSTKFALHFLVSDIYSLYRDR